MPAARRSATAWSRALMKAQAAGKVSIDPAAFDPDAVLAAMMVGEKPGGDMERSVGIGTIEIAMWDAVAKIAGMPAYQLIADRYRGGQVAARRVLLRRRRLVSAGQGRARNCSTRCAAISTGATR